MNKKQMQIFAEEMAAIIGRMERYEDVEDRAIANGEEEKAKALRFRIIKLVERLTALDDALLWLGYYRETKLNERADGEVDWYHPIVTIHSYKDYGK